MKKNLIFVFALILLAFSCSSTQKAAVKEQMYDGAVLFNSQKYTEAIKVFEKVLEKDPENANAAYNIAISYIQLKNDDKALIYLNKATDINKFYYDAWYNMAILEFNKGKYKKAVAASFHSGKEGKEIIEKSFVKLKEAGFPNKNFAQLKEKISLPQDVIISESYKKKIFFSLLVSKSGTVEKVICGKEKEIIGKLQQDQDVDQEEDSSKEKEICDFFIPFLSSLEFIPAYNFYKNELKNSEEIGFISINKEASAQLEMKIFNGLEMTNLLKEVPEKKEYFVKNDFNNSGSGKAVITGAIDISDINASVKKALSKIRWCYEKEVHKDHYLSGKIVVNFIINENGSVPIAKIRTSTMDNEFVEKCLANQIKKIRFPLPKGGGIMIVNYNFVFKHSIGCKNQGHSYNCYRTDVTAGIGE